MNRENEIEEQQKSIYFHSKEKGCELVPSEVDIVQGSKTTMLKCLYCKTHDTKICKCGWQWHYHFKQQGQKPNNK